MSMSPEATKAALTALMYAYLCKAGPDAKIPDFSSSFGHRLTASDHKMLEPLFEAARCRAADISMLRGQ